MLYRRFLPLITPVIIWLLSQVFLLKSSLFFVAVALGALVIVLSVKVIAQPVGQHGWVAFTIAPVLFFVSLAAYVTILPHNLWIQFVFLVIVYFLFFYLRNLYYYLTYEAPERADKLDNLLIVGSFLNIFAAAAVFFSLPAFLSWSSIVMLPALFMIVLLLFIQFLPIKKKVFSSVAGLILVSTLVISELAWVFSLWPLSFNILALILALIFYLFLTINRLTWQGRMSRRAIKIPLILSSIIILILLLTASWL